MKLSITIPVYNNENTLTKLVEQCFSSAKKRYKLVEIIAVDDGSTDRSFEVLQKIAKKNKNLKIIKLTRNFGQHIAMMAGLEAVNADHYLWIDADLEEKPEYIIPFKEKLEEGYEIVVGVRENARHSLYRRVTAKIFSYTFSRMCDYPIIDNATNMRLMTQKFKEHLVKFSELPFIGGMTSWTGVKIGIIRCQWVNSERKSSYSLIKLIKHGKAGLIQFSSKLLRLSSVLGVVVSSMSFCYIIYLFVLFLYQGRVVPGYYSIIVLLSICFGLQSIFLGIIGEYISEIFELLKNRPKYLIDKTINF
jgi:dolichol-phosphate mannosyltransferase